MSDSGAFFYFFFFFNDTATTEIYTLSLHDALPISIAKLFVSEAAGRVADRCVQIFGGRGYMRENVAERFFRELRVERIWEGTSEVQKVIIADQLAKRGAAALIE